MLKGECFKTRIAGAMKVKLTVPALQSQRF